MISKWHFFVTFLSVCRRQLKQKNCFRKFWQQQRIEEKKKTIVRHSNLMVVCLSSDCRLCLLHFCRFLSFLTTKHNIERKCNSCCHFGGSMVATKEKKRHSRKAKNFNEITFWETSNEFFAYHKKSLFDWAFHHSDGNHDGTIDYVSRQRAFVQIFPSTLKPKFRKHFQIFLT